VVIFPEHLGSKAFQQGIDVFELATAYKDITGRSFPIVTPPAPTPVPSPTPSGPPQTVVDWANAHHTGHTATIAKELKAWLATL
jgi:hypothetical protein